MVQNIAKTVKFGGMSLMVWGAINGDGRRILIRCPDIMNSVSYQAILSKGLFDVCDRETIFMQDGAPCHRSKSTVQYLENNNICYISDWPAQSPDLNIIENLWSILKLRISKLNPTSTDHLWHLCKSEWAKISNEEIERLYNSIPRRIASILKANGLNTKY